MNTFITAVLIAGAVAIVWMVIYCVIEDQRK